MNLDPFWLRRFGIFLVVLAVIFFSYPPLNSPRELVFDGEIKIVPDMKNKRYQNVPKLFETAEAGFEYTILVEGHRLQTIYSANERQSAEVVKVCAAGWQGARNLKHPNGYKDDRKLQESAPIANANLYAVVVMDEQAVPVEKEYITSQQCPRKQGLKFTYKATENEELYIMLNLPEENSTVVWPFSNTFGHEITVYRTKI